MKMKMEREVVLMGSNQSPQSPSPRSRRSFCNGNMSSMPVWLLSNLADLEERMKNLEINKIEAENEGDTFAERAECYYRKRPQLLTLLQDLYNSYINLADRYKQTINKHHHHRQVSSIDFDCKEYRQHEDFDGISSEIESEVESSLSYQQPPSVQMAQHDSTALVEGDGIVLEFVMKNVEFEILLHELTGIERRCCESSRKIELQKSLLEVLESERLILLNENASLGYRVAALVEENKGLVSESLFMKRRAGELARCVLRMREDQRVSMLSRKIEDLQGQIFGLEKRNKEYYDQLVKREQQLPDDDSTAKTTEKNGNEVALDACFQMGKLNKRLMKKEIIDGHRKGVAKKSGSWWKRVKNMDLFLCGLN